MPRSNRQLFPSLEYGRIQNETDSEDSESGNDSSIEENVMEMDWNLQDEDMDWNSGSDLFQDLHTVSDELLTFVAAGCYERITDLGFSRFLASHSSSFRKDALKLWKNDMSTFNKHYICNNCGKEVNRTSSCCGPIIKYLRIGGFEQLCDVVKQYTTEIMNIRDQLKSGTDICHNLTGSYLRKMWESETGNQLKLSLIGSIDGVSLSGNSKSKIWPVTMLIVDLPTAEMQRAKNLVLHGLAEGSVNPSTVFWNSIVPMIYADIESQRIRISSFDIRFSICSWVADQPAKRALFGMKACNAESSCFFGMCTGTHYKKQARNRCQARAGSQTDEDAKAGLNGFGSIPPKILEYIYPYDTIIDLLHNASEGIIPLLISETMSMDRSVQRRSDLFENDRKLHSELCDKVIVPKEFAVVNMTNGSEKLTFFRVYFGLASLVNPTLKPEARLVISSLMLLTNQLYSNAPAYAQFYVHLTAAPRWALETASNTYLATKAHELLSHLPYVIEKFGNVAPLSTFAYEHYYKYCLKGFNAQKTNGFTESAIARALLHSAITREIQYRSVHSPSRTLEHFLEDTPQLKPFQVTWKNLIEKLKQEDEMAETKGWDCFATLVLSVGRLQSRYKKESPLNEIFFAVNLSGFHTCYRFVAVCIRGDSIKVIGERIEPINPLDQFPLLKNDADSMRRPENTYAFNVLDQFKRYSGLVHGRPKGKRELIDIGSIKGMGASLQDGAASYYLQINGACVHH